MIAIDVRLLGVVAILLPHSQAIAQCDIQKLLQPSVQLNDFFGYGVAVSDTVAAVGAYGADTGAANNGNVAVFERQGQAWNLTATIVSTDTPGVADEFGRSVAVSDETIAVGARGRSAFSGAVYVFENDGTNWVQIARLTASDAGSVDRLGTSVGIDGDIVVAGSPGDDDGGLDAGAAYVFEDDPVLGWIQTAKLVASDAASFDTFGTSVAVSGDRIVVGAPTDDDNGSDSGSVYIFENDAVLGWVEVAKFSANDGAAGDEFSVVQIDGDTIVVGARLDDDNGTDSGSAYVFDFDGVNWIQTAKLLPSSGAAGDEFGAATAIDGDTVIVGAALYDGTSIDEGAAYVYTRSSGIWSQQSQLVATDVTQGDNYGIGVALSGDTALLGSQFADTFVTGGGTAYLMSVSGTACPTLTTDITLLSLSQGGVQTFTYDGNAANAGQFYLLGGSISGNWPGFPFGGFTVPLNLDSYFNITVQSPNLPPLSNSAGFLDSNGNATALLSLSAGTDPTLAGIIANHAMVVYDITTGAILDVSNPVELHLTP